jgi:dienelactone hydrolase
MLLSPVFVESAMRTESVVYKQGGVKLEGYLAYDDSIKGNRPAVLIVHEWTGIGDYVKRRAEQLAEEGYIAFAADIYGQGIRPKDRTEAAKQAGIYRADRALMRARVKAGLDQLKKNKLTDINRIAAIGYCFGGGTVLELARSGADIAGVVSFHGNLDTPHPEEAKNIRAKVLVLHGGDDPYISSEQLKLFEDEMRSSKVDWQLVIYGNAVHSFTNPESGEDSSQGAAYNEKADQRSWKAMLSFFKEIFT